MEEEKQISIITNNTFILKINDLLDFPQKSLALHKNILTVFPNVLFQNYTKIED